MVLREMSPLANVLEGEEIEIRDEMRNEAWNLDYRCGNGRDFSACH